MPALSDIMLTSGCAAQVAVIHGEAILVLSGPDAGKTFHGVIETATDLVLTTDLGADARGRLVVRFTPDQTPNIRSQCPVQIVSSGKKYNMVREDFSAFLTNDFELKEIVAGLDT